MPGVSTARAGRNGNSIFRKSVQARKNYSPQWRSDWITEVRRRSRPKPGKILVPCHCVLHFSFCSAGAGMQKYFTPTRHSHTRPGPHACGSSNVSIWGPKLQINARKSAIMIILIIDVGFVLLPTSTSIPALSDWAGERREEGEVANAPFQGLSRSEATAKWPHGRRNSLAGPVGPQSRAF